MEHLRLRATPQLRAPVLLYAFTGWNDAGDAASSALRTMVDQWGATPLGDVDPEPFTDFATVRPTVYLDDGGRRIRWPATEFWTASLPGADVILLLGPEPALRWRLFSEQIISLAELHGVSLAISLGALLADYPHTHPVQVIGTATNGETIERFELRRSTYEGPTGIVGVLGDALATAGLATTSLWATVPGYASQFPSPRACEALLVKACGLVGTAPPTHLFDAANARYDATIAEMVADNEDLANYVERLEELMAEDEEGVLAEDDRDDEVADEGAIANLVEEVERFLKQSGEPPPG